MSSVHDQDAVWEFTMKMFVGLPCAIMIWGIEAILICKLLRWFWHVVF